MYVCGILAGSSGFFGNFLPNRRNDRNYDTRIAVIIMPEMYTMSEAYCNMKPKQIFSVWWNDCTLASASEHALNW